MFYIDDILQQHFFLWHGKLLYEGGYLRLQKPAQQLKVLVQILNHHFCSAVANFFFSSIALQFSCTFAKVSAYSHNEVNYLSHNKVNRPKHPKWIKLLSNKCSISTFQKCSACSSSVGWYFVIGLPLAQGMWPLHLHGHIEIMMVTSTVASRPSP